MKQIVLMMMVVLGLSVTFASAETEAVNLRPKFEVGRVTRYEYWTQRDQHTVMQLMGNEQAMDQTLIFRGEIIWKVSKIQSNGSAICEMTFDWLSMEIKSNGESHTVDTRKGPGDIAELHQFLKAIANKPLMVHVNVDGSIEKIVGIKAILREIGDTNNPPDERDFEESAANLATLVSAPAESAIGTSWKCDFTWNHDAGELKYKTRYTLDDVGELEGVPVAMVSSESKMKMDFDRSKIPPEAPPVTFTFNGGQQAEQVVFDLSRGEAIARHNTQTISYAMTIRIEQGTVVRKVEETTLGQILRIAE